MPNPKSIPIALIAACLVSTCGGATGDMPASATAATTSPAQTPAPKPAPNVPVDPHAHPGESKPPR